MDFYSFPSIFNTAIIRKVYRATIKSVSLMKDKKLTPITMLNTGSRAVFEPYQRGSVVNYISKTGKLTESSFKACKILDVFEISGESGITYNYRIIDPIGSEFTVSHNQLLAIDQTFDLLAKNNGYWEATADCGKIFLAGDKFITYAANTSYVYNKNCTVFIQPDAYNKVLKFINPKKDDIL